MVQPFSVLLTGATGYLGSHLLSVLREMIRPTDSIAITTRSFGRLKTLGALADGVTVLDLEQTTPKEFFSRRSIDVVIHCATAYGRPISDPDQLEASNVAFPLEICRSAIASGTKLIVNTDTALPEDINPYAASKARFRTQLRTLIENSSARALNLKLEHFYGAGDTSEKFVTWLVHSLIKEVPELALTSGMQKRDFIHVDDVVSAYAFLLSRWNNLFTFTDGAGGDSGEIGNRWIELDIGSGTPIALKDFALLVKSLTGNRTTELKFGAVPLRDREAMETRADLAKLTELGWHPVIHLKDGLARMIREERESLDKSPET